MSWRAADGVFVQEIDGEMIVFDSSGNRYLTLNETGAVIYESAADGASLGEIADRLVDGWSVDTEVATDRANAFVSKLVDAGILLPR